MQNEPLKIKKYANRRLYDTEQSRYITLAELASIVREGRRVEVVDAKAGTDLTRQVLVQVILEEQERLDMLPPELLHGIIRMQGTMQGGALTTFLADGMNQFMAAGETWKDQVEESLDQVASVAAEGAKMWMGAVEGMFRDFTTPGAAADPAPRASAGTTPPEPAEEEPEEQFDLAKDVEDLKAKMAQLMDILSGKND